MVTKIQHSFALPARLHGPPLLHKQLDDGAFPLARTKQARSRVRTLEPNMTNHIIFRDPIPADVNTAPGR